MVFGKMSILEFDKIRYMGLIGSLLVLPGIIFPVLAIMGFTLVFVSLYFLSDIYGNRGIFRNALIAFAAALIGPILIAIITIFSGIAILGGKTIAEELTPPMIIFFSLLTLLFLSNLGIVAYFWYKAFAELSRMSGEMLFLWFARVSVIIAILLAITVITFVTGGLLFIKEYVGIAILTYYLTSIVVLVNSIILATAFYQMKAPSTSPTTPSSLQASSTS